MLLKVLAIASYNISPLFWPFKVRFHHITRRLSMSLGFSWYGTHCPCLWMTPIAFKRLETVETSTLSSSAFISSVKQGFWSREASSSVSSNFFGCPGRSLSSRSKSPLLNQRNQFSTV